MEPKDLTDRELIAACIAGQAGVLEEFLGRFGEAIHFGAASALGSGAAWFSVEIEDLVQGFYLELVEWSRRDVGRL